MFAALCVATAFAIWANLVSTNFLDLLPIK